VVELAKSLLGKVMIRKINNDVIKAVIVETEAYKAPLDKACHAFNSTFDLNLDKKTDKTKYFWLDGGHLYIYTIYMPTNICLNVVAGLEGEPEAVLIRAVQPITGIDAVRSMRDIKSNKVEDLTNGPGKVGQALGIDKEKMNGIDLTDGDFTIVDAGIDGFNMDVSRRVNIDYAEEWIDKPWRFFVKGNTFVSKVNFTAPKEKKDKKEKKEKTVKK
jgi:DNA-3-methyladenine glycosylase